MSNGIILPVSWADNMTISASSEASAELGATNVLDTQPSVPWRSNSGTVHTLAGDFGAARPVTVAALWRHNLGGAATAALDLASDAGISQDVVSHQWPGRYAMRATDGPVGGDADGIYQAPYVVGVIPEVPRRYWRWTISLAAPGNAEVGRMMIGLGWQPPINYEWGLSVSWRDPSTTQRAQGGQLRVLSRPKYRAATIRWQWLDANGADIFSDITYRIGVGNTVLVIPYPNDLDTARGRQSTFLGRIVSHSGPHEAEHGFVASTQLEEVL